MKLIDTKINLSLQLKFEKFLSLLLNHGLKNKKNKILYHNLIFKILRDQIRGEQKNWKTEKTEKTGKKITEKTEPKKKTELTD